MEEWPTEDAGLVVGGDGGGQVCCPGPPGDEVESN